MRGCDMLAPTCRLRNEERLTNVCLYELGRWRENKFLLLYVGCTYFALAGLAVLRLGDWKEAFNDMNVWAV